MKKIITLSLILATITALGQSRSIDSLKKVLSLQKEDTLTVIAMKQLCIKLMETGNFNEAKGYGEKELRLSTKLGYKKGMGDSYMQIGDADSWLGNYADASRSFFNALKIRESLKDTRGIASTYTNIGNVSLYKKDYSDAIKYYSLSMGMQKKVGNKNGVADCFNNIAIVLSNQGKYEESIYNYTLALKIYEELGKKSASSYVYWGMAVIQSEQKDYSDAMSNYMKSLSIMKEINDTKGIAGCYSDIGVSYIKQKKFSDAKRILNEAIELSKKTGDKNTAKTSYEAISKVDSVMLNYKSAYENYKMFSSYKDSLFNEASTKKIVQNQMQYEFGKKEDATKAEQDKKDAVTAQEKQKQRIIIYSVSAGLFLVLLLAIFIFRGYKQKQKANIVISKQKKIVDERNAEITASIRYASRIQQAILPPSSTVNEIMPEHQIYFEPKDIVSGDFYFIDKKDEKIIWATCDCTGHGASGAMLSMLGSNILSGVIKDGETVPSKILDKLNERVNDSLHKTGDDSIRDGMDVTLCSLDKNTMTLNYAGANNPLWIIRSGEIIEYKADKMPIGQMYKTASYTNHEIKLQSGDSIYSFSDGICDLHSEDDKKFMKKRLREMLLSFQDKSMSEQKQIISETLNQWKGNAEQVDDMLLIGVKV